MHRQAIERVLAAGVAALGLTALARADTWIVDDGGGPGVDFTDLPPAVAAAVPGDVILVMPGSYSGFVLDESLTILGMGPGVTVTGAVTIRDIQSGSATILADMSWNAMSSITDCLRPVVLDGMTLRDRVTVTDSTDVRIARSSLLGSSHFSGNGNGDGVDALDVADSRVELSDSSARGADGLDDHDPVFALGGWGGHGVAVIGRSGEVHVYRTDMTGGDGGDGIATFEPYGCSGQGGDGLLVHSYFQAPPASALVAGTGQQEATGGAAGFSTDPDCNLGPGWGIENTGELRVSGIAVASLANSGTVLQPVPRDPCVYVLGSPHAGQVTTFRIAAEPGASVDLLLGRQATIVPIGGLEEDVLVLPQRVLALGVVGANGIAGFNFPVPATLPQGFVFFAQARVRLPGGEIRYTNSIPLVLR